MSSRLEVAARWDDVLRSWAPGAIPLGMENWAASFSGRGDGEVIYDAFPEPYIGNLGTGIPIMVMLGLNPGQAELAFQGVDGVFTRQIGTSSYSRWAAGGGVDTSPRPPGRAK